MAAELDLLALPGLLEPYGWTDVAPMWAGRRAPGRVDVTVCLKPSAWNITEIAALRADYYTQAEKALAALAGAGYTQVGDCRIEISDHVALFKPPSTPDDRHAEAVLRVELTAG